MNHHHVLRRVRVFEAGRLRASTVFVVLTVSICIFVLLGWGKTLVWAHEAVSHEEPYQTSLNQRTSSIERSFLEKVAKPGLFPQLHEKMKDLNPFFRDTRIDVNLRTYYFYCDQYDNSVNEAWAIGGALSYKSGWLLNHFGIGAAFYISEPLYGPADRDGTMLLKEGQKGYANLGQLYARVKLFEDHFLNLYRYEYNTPYINKKDIRMTPMTFEGYTFQGTSGGSHGAPGFKYLGGYITKIKVQNSDDFVWMSRQAGVPVDRGVWFGNAVFSLGRFSIGAVDYYCDDVINIAYTEAKYTWPVTEKLGLLFAAQFTEQRSVGKDLLTGDSFSANQAGVKTEMNYGGALLSLAFTAASGGAYLQNPWGGYPGYTSVMVQDFNRANEKAFFVNAAYDFTSLGFEGLTAYALFVHGWDRRNPITGQDEINENELDIDLQWKPKTGIFRHFWPRLRYALVQERGGQERAIHVFRIILNYDFSLR
jgi:hypothetical protein